MDISIDIETIPEQPEDEARDRIAKKIQPPGQIKSKDSIADWHNGRGKYVGVKDAAIDEAYLKTALDGGQGEICSIAIHTGPASRVFCGGRELDLICGCFDAIKDLCRKEAPFFIGHHVGFDLRFIYQRAVILGIKPGFHLPHNGRHGNQFFCTMTDWAGYNNYIKLDLLAWALGIQCKTGMTGADVWPAFKEGRFDEIASYNLEDAKVAMQIYHRQNFKGAF